MGARTPPTTTYGHDRARLTLRGIDDWVTKAEKAVAVQVPIKRNRFIRFDGGTTSVNRELEAKARALAGLKSCVTNLAACADGAPTTAEFVIGAFHRLFQIEEILQDEQKVTYRPRPSAITARPDRSPPDHRLAALAVSRWIEARAGWSIRKFVRTARRYKTIEIRADVPHHRRPSVRQFPRRPRPHPP